MKFEDFKINNHMLPLRLMRIVIDDDGIMHDSRHHFKNESHKSIFAFVHQKYKSYTDKISDANGHMLVKINSNGNPISIEVKDAPLELKEEIK